MAKIKKIKVFTGNYVDAKPEVVLMRLVKRPWLRNIKRVEVAEEDFPLDERPNWMKKKYYRFNITYNRKNNSLFSSGRFREKDLVMLRLEKYLKGSFESCFGNVNKKGK